MQTMIIAVRGASNKRVRVFNKHASDYSDCVIRTYQNLDNSHMSTLNMLDLEIQRPYREQTF